MRTIKAAKRVQRESTPRKTTKRKAYDINTFPQLFDGLGGAERIAKRLHTTVEKIEDWALGGYVPRGHNLMVYVSLQARNLTCHPKLFGLGALGWRYLVIPKTLAR